MAIETRGERQKRLDRERKRQRRSSQSTEDRAIRLSALRTSQRRRLEEETEETREALFIKMFFRVRDYFNRLVDNFGFKFAATLVSIYGGLKGTNYQLVGNAALPFFKNLKVTGERYQSYGTVASTPWVMKAAIGLLSDVVPIFGYHKRAYMAIVSVVGTAALASLGLAPLNASHASIAALLLLLVNLQVASVDLLTEGKYAELMVRRPDTGSDLVSFVWGLFSVGALIGSVVAGPMADHFNPRLIYLVALPFAAQVVVPVLSGWFPEERLPPGRRGIRYDRLAQHPNLVKLSIAMTVGALVVGISALGPGILQSSISVFIACTLAALGFIWLPETLRRANLYLFLNSMLYVSLSGALDYWFTADSNCVPDGPHFSMTYYVTYANIVGSIASIVGVALFQRYLSRGKFRVAFWATGLVKLVASLFDFAIVKRYNHRIGISDRAFFMMGDAIIVQVVGMFELMPTIVLTSKVCPPGMEASVYALLVSYQNLGSGVASTLGVGLIEVLKIDTNIPCDFSKLPLGILIAHVFLPALSFPLVFFLIPDARMTDDLIRPSVNDDDSSDFAIVDSEDSGDSNNRPDGVAQQIVDDFIAHDDSEGDVSTDLITQGTENGSKGRTKSKDILIQDNGNSSKNQNRGSDTSNV